MMDNFDKAAETFFGELALTANSGLCMGFKAMLRELALRCAIEGGANPAVGLDRWVGGRISICDELTNRADEALARERAKANPALAEGFSDAPI